MNVEINTRQTGKTTRLLKHLFECPDEKVCIVCVTVAAAKTLVLRYKMLYPTDFRYILPHSVMQEGYTNFVDEFDHIDHSRIFYCEKSYYCGTLASKLCRTVVHIEYNDPLDILNDANIPDNS